MSLKTQHSRSRPKKQRNMPTFKTKQLINYFSAEAPPPVAAVDEDSTTGMAAIHHDILQTHILTRLDGPTLASVGCASSQLYKLSSQEALWTHLCHSAWPSTATPLLRHTMANFPGGARSFFYDAFPLPTDKVFDNQSVDASRSNSSQHGVSTHMRYNSKLSIAEAARLDNESDPNIRRDITSWYNGFVKKLFLPVNVNPVPTTDLPFDPYRFAGLVSAVDIYCKEKLVLSKVVETETVTGWFRCSPFRVDLLDPKDVVPTSIKYPEAADFHDTCKNLEDDLRLSWILIDPIVRRAMNVSSEKPVSAQRHWLTGELEARFSVILEGKRGTSSEHVQCEVLVTCGGSPEGKTQVREVSLQVKDLDGMHMNGKDSLVIVQRALDGKRGMRGRGKEAEGKRRYEEFIQRMRERRERKLKAEGRLDSLCVGAGILICTLFWLLILFR